MYIGAELKTFERGPMALRRRVPATSLFALIFLSCAAAPLQAQAPRPATFLAEHYDISATLDAIGQSISATAKIDFKAVEASSSVRVELHPNLVVKEVKGADGKSLTFERDNQNSLIVVVQLPTPVATAGHVTLTYTYSGLLVNEENSPVPGVRAALIDRKSTRLNSSHGYISYAVFCLKKKNKRPPPVLFQAKILTPKPNRPERVLLRFPLALRQPTVSHQCLSSPPLILGCLLAR